MSRSLFYGIVVIVSLLLLWTCASERAIKGGPEDHEAPKIIFSSPENESVNVDLNPVIFIKFSEQMKKSTFSAALQIWPRPPGNFEVKSGWTWLKISFSEPLEENITYLLTLDKSVQDLRGNGLESTYVLAFSTGEILNSGHISGYIHGSRSIKKNGSIYLYRQYDTPLDELRTLPADYIFQPDNDGAFELSYLAERSYMLFYHWDRNHNKMIDGDDYFARPEHASVIATSDSIRSIQKLWPRLRPLDSVKILEASALASQFIQVRLNRPVRFESLDQIKLIADGQSVPVLGAALAVEDEYALRLHTALPLQDHARVWLKNFQDTSGFLLSSDTIEFTASTTLDTLKFEDLLVKWSTGSLRRFPDESSNMLITSNLPFTFKSDSAFQVKNLKADSILIPGSFQKKSSTEWEFIPDSVLNSGQTYQWQIRNQFVYSAIDHQPLDSLVQGKLFTVNEDSLGSIRIAHSGDATLVCQLTGKDISRDFLLERGKPYLLEQLPAQNYFLTAYMDQDGNGRYNSGGLGAVSGSEPFYIYPAEIRVRARWETDLGEWVLE